MPHNYIKSSFLMVILFVGKAFAQGPPPPPPPTPIDGGIIGLFIIATAFGIKKIRDKYNS